MAPGGLVRYFPEHLGTAFLRTMLHRAGIPSKQYLPPRNPGLNGFAAELREMRPAVVGFTVYETNLVLTRTLVRVVRETLPEAVVLVGGPNATFSPEETLELLGADGCLRGAGEGRIVPVVEAILGASSPRKELGRSLTHVKNLVLQTPDGVVATPLGSLSSFPDEGFETLDDIPSPFQAGLVSTPDIGYLTARGCNQHCTYCSFATISGRKVQFHSPERVIDDLEALKPVWERGKRHNPTFTIFDDAFTLAPNRARRICEGLIARNLRLPLTCATRVDFVDADLLRLMHQAGFLSVSYGLESAVPRVLRSIGKVRPPEAAVDPDFSPEKRFLDKFRETVAETRGVGLHAGISIIGGLPAETPDDFRTTLDFVDSLGVGQYIHNTLSVFPGTPLFDNRYRYGMDAFRDPKTLQWETRLAFDTRSVRPLSGSSTLTSKWESAARLSDALCGRPSPENSAADSAWAVVIHDEGPSESLLQWLRDVLAIHGTLVVLGDGRHSEADWLAALVESAVPFGQLFVLNRVAVTGSPAYESSPTSGGHRVTICSTWTREEAVLPVTVDERGGCRFALWIASAPDAGAGGDTIDGGTPVVGPGLQIADSCRWWNRSPRCSQPGVLHVKAPGEVRPCWHGPVAGTLSTSFGSIRRRCRRHISKRESGLTRFAGGEKCPLSLPGEGTLHARLEDLDLASQLSWLFPRRNAVENNLTRKEV